MAIMAAIRALSWLAGSLFLAAAPTASQPAATAPIIDPAAAKAAGLTLYWQRSIPLEAGERVLRIVHVDEYLYVLTDKGGVIALDAAAGVLRWARFLVSPDIRLHGPTHDASRIYFTSVLGIHALDRRTGEPLFVWKQGFAPAGPVSSDGEMLFGGSIGNRVYAVRLRDMAVLWQFATLGQAPFAPILGDREFVVVSQGGRIYAATKEDKAELWVTSLNDQVMVRPSSSGNRLYVACIDQATYGLDMTSGRIIWRTRMPAPLYDSPRATAERLYQPIEGHGFWALNPATGEELWRLEDGADLAAEHDKSVWVISTHGSLLGVEKATGEVRLEVPMEAQLWVANEQDDPIWLATLDGTVVCVRPIGAGFLRYSQVQAAAGGVPATQPGAQPAGDGQIDLPPNPKRPTDWLRAREGITPIGGRGAPATQGAQ